jgi:hypothetical protein
MVIHALSKRVAHELRSPLPLPTHNPTAHGNIFDLLEQNVYIITRLLEQNLYIITRSHQTDFIYPLPRSHPHGAGRDIAPTCIFAHW